jgi:DNA-binding winged helix-turn-helix (wHTH) protein/pimeloyl-ACP methyl ester carboxylesterase
MLGKIGQGLAAMDDLETFQFGSFQLIPSQRELLLDGKPVAIGSRAFDVLQALVRRNGRLASKGELLAEVWPGIVVEENNLQAQISALRKIFSRDLNGTRFLQTVPARGYRFIAKVERQPAGGPSVAVNLLAPEQSKASIRSAAENFASSQTVTFCQSPDGIRLAVAEVGEGDVIVKTGNWLNHVEYDWKSPVWIPTFGRWASANKLIRYDQRGTGLSDWNAADISFDAFLCDLETVVHSIGVKRFAILGISQGAAVAIAFAARYPEKVTKLVLHGSYALGRNKRYTPQDRDRAAAYLALIRQGWGDHKSAFMQAFSSLYLPDSTSDQIKWFSDLQRVTTSAENAVRIRQACDDVDVIDLLPSVRAPTLVLHSRSDSVVPLEQGRLVASHISGAKFVGLDSSNHIILPQEPGWNTFMNEIDRFLQNQS